MKGQRGVALLLVLWVLALLGTLLGALAATVQVQHRQAQWQVDHTQALLAAEAGLAQAISAQQARDPLAHWPADGQPHTVRFGAASLAVSVRSERGKLDLNAAPVADVRRLLAACGVNGPGVDRAVQALQQRRQGPVPVRALEELREMPGVSWPAYRCAVPWITVWSGQAQPDAALTPAPLARLLGLPQVHAPGTDPGPIFTVTSVAHLPDGGNATLQVTLMLNTAKEGARPYRVLRWQE